MILPVQGATMVTSDVTFALALKELTHIKVKINTVSIQA